MLLTAGQLATAALLYLQVRSQHFSFELEWVTRFDDNDNYDDDDVIDNDNVENMG